MTDTDKKISDLIKDIEQSISLYAAVVAAKEYLLNASRFEEFDREGFINSLGPHVRRSDLM